MTTQTINSSETRMDALNQAYDQFKESISGLHTVLWEILVNQPERFLDGNHAFVLHVGDGFYELGIATRNERGYLPTAGIATGHDYHAIHQVVDKLNEIVFGLEKLDAARIECSSMRGV